MLNPVDCATAAAASRSLVPSATRARTSVAASSNDRTRCSPGAITITISPRTSPLAHSSSSPAVPRRTSSNFFVSSRHTAIWRSGSASAMSATVDAMRCGDSKTTTVRGSAASDAKYSSRCPFFLGRKPSNANRSVGSPLTASATTTALGPGRQVTSTPWATASRTRTNPGSETVGMPASVSTSTSSSAARPTRSAATARSLCSCRAMSRSARRRRALAHEPDGRSGVFCRDDLHGVQCVDQPRGGVAEVADGCRSEDDHRTIVP